MRRPSPRLRACSMKLSRRLPSPAIRKATSRWRAAMRAAMAMKSCGRFCGTSRAANPTTTRAPGGRRGPAWPASGRNCSRSTPFSTTSLGAETSGAIFRSTAAEQQRSRSGGDTCPRPASATTSQVWTSVPPQRHTIGMPCRRAIRVAVTHENGIAARITSIRRSRTSRSTWAALRATQAA